MDNNLPIDFEEKVKLPPPANGIGYPYRISAKDLMKDFVFSSPIIEEVTPSGNKNGITVTETTGQGGNKARKISCTYVPEGKADGSLLQWKGDKWATITPPNLMGSMIYWDGQYWAQLPPPTTGGDALWVLGHTGIRPYWRDIASIL